MRSDTSHPSVDIRGDKDRGRSETLSTIDKPGAVMAVASLLLFAAVRACTTGERVCANWMAFQRRLLHYPLQERRRCLYETLGAHGRYAIRFRLARGENLVVSKGWRAGSANCQVVYRAERFEPGTNGYLQLYGWTINSLVETYVMESWARQFTPQRRLGRTARDGEKRWRHLHDL